MSSIFPMAHLALMSPEIPRIVNFIIFAAVLYHLLRRPVSQFFQDRAQRIAVELDRARAEREAARSRLLQIESRLHRLDDEIKELQVQAAAEADAEEARIKAAAEAEAEKLRLLARREITSTANVARLELKAFAANQAIEMARDIIRREITDEDHHWLIEHFSQQLQEVRR